MIGFNFASAIKVVTRFIRVDLSKAPEEVANTMQYCLITDKKTGGALIGRVSIPSLDAYKAVQAEDVTKTSGDTSDWHHPTYPTLIRVMKGSHAIIVQNTNGQQTLMVGEGDEVLFLDFKPADTIENPQGCHSGHWSQAGAEGVTLQKYILVTPAIEDLGWTDFK